MNKSQKYTLILAAAVALGVILLANLVLSLVPLVPDPGDDGTPTAIPTLDAGPQSLVQPAAPEVAQAVIDAIGWSVERTQIRQGEMQDGSTLSYLTLVAVSSGEFGQVELPVKGNPRLDVVYAYLPTKSGVVRLPVALGFELNGEYHPVFEAYGARPGLGQVQALLPKGQTFGLMTTNVSLQGVERANCAADWCEMAIVYHKAHPNAERMFISKIALDANWIPVGWDSFLYPQEDPDYFQIIQLP